MLPHYLATADKDTYFITFPPCKIHTELEFKCRYYIFPPKNCRLARNAFFFLKQAWKTMLQSFFCVPFCNVRKRVQDFFLQCTCTTTVIKAQYQRDTIFLLRTCQSFVSQGRKISPGRTFFFCNTSNTTHWDVNPILCPFIHTFIHSFLSIDNIFFELLMNPLKSNPI